MLFYEEYKERRGLELLYQYRQLSSKKITFETFVDEQYQQYVKDCHALYRKQNDVDAFFHTEEMTLHAL